MNRSISITDPLRNTPTTSIVEFARHHFSPYDFFRLQTPVPSANASSAAVAAGATLLQFSKLQADWDGYGALPLTSESCAHAHHFLSATPEGMVIPEISPTANGTITFEWESGGGEAYLEIGRTRYSGHIRPRHGRVIYLQGQLADSLQEKLASEQALLVIKQLLYASSGSGPSTHTIQITQPAF